MKKSTLKIETKFVTKEELKKIISTNNIPNYTKFELYENEK